MLSTAVLTQGKRIPSPGRRPLVPALGSVSTPAHLEKEEFPPRERRESEKSVSTKWGSN